MNWDKRIIWPIRGTDRGLISRRIGADFCAILCGACILLFLTLLSGCSKQPTEAEAAVPVQAAPVQKTTIQQTVNSEAILFPLQQSALVPKISAPVKKF